MIDKMVCVLTVLITAVGVAAGLPGRIQFRSDAFLDAQKRDLLKAGTTQTHGGLVDETWQDDIWEYWSVKGGSIPADFVLQPMTYAEINSPSWSKISWSGCFVGDAAMKKTPFANIHGFYVRVAKTGAGYSLRNPYPSGAKVIIEGMLRINSDYENFPVFVYRKAEDKVDILTSTNDSHAISTTSCAKGHIRHYLKLQIDISLAPGERVFIISTAGPNSPKGGKQETLIEDNDRWGIIYRPTFFVVPENSQNQ